jgi:rare lipoprotein A
MTACARSAYVDVQASRVRVMRLWRGSVDKQRNIFRCLVLVLEPSREVGYAPVRRVSIVRRHNPFPSHREATTGGVRPYGVASFYGEGTKTANGEAFDPRELTAAHRSLPFGTKLRVTNVATGQSVTVRVNDRGPFIRGRDVDVSTSAAEQLGMVGGGIAKVKMDVVQ